MLSFGSSLLQCHKISDVFGYLLHLYLLHYSHFVKGVCIQSYSGLHFPSFWLNTERYEVPLCIQPKCGNTDTFHAVLLMYYLFGYACSKWCIICEIYLLISFACICCCCFYFGFSNCWSYLLKSMRITLVTKPWLQHCGLEPDLPICFLSSNHIIIYFNPGFCSKF